MSSREKSMAQVLARHGRRYRLQAVAQLIDPAARLILDLGCGIGALIPYLVAQAPNAQIVGIDLSLHHLNQIKKIHSIKRNSLLQVQVPQLSFRHHVFDAVVALQSLHEVFHFIGVGALTTTLQQVYEFLQEGGTFTIFDHRNPGPGTIEVKLAPKLLTQLDYFVDRFKVRKIVYKMLGDRLVKISLRDFYDFITKTWALGKPLEGEEMEETHTPYTSENIIELLRGAGFTITCNRSLTPIPSHTTRYQVSKMPGEELPDRHLLVQGKK